MIEPEIKLVFASLFLLMWLGGRAHSHAVLPAFILGLAMSNHYATHRKEQERLRVVAFAFLTPFFFLKGGMNVSTSALWANLGVLALLFAGEDGAEARRASIRSRAGSPRRTPCSRRCSCRPASRSARSASLYGLNAGIIDRTQFSLLIAVVVLSAIVPTVIAQRFYQPRRPPTRRVRDAARDGRGVLATHEPNALRRSRSRSGSTRWPSRST